jgi:hypothetical protein
MNGVPYCSTRVFTTAWSYFSRRTRRLPIRLRCPKQTVCWYVLCSIYVLTYARHLHCASSSCIPIAMFPLQFVFAIAFVGLVRASLVKRQAITTLSSTEIDAFAPFTHFASAAYCSSSSTINWSCGGVSTAILWSTPKALIAIPVANCDANPDFQPVASGGNGDTTQFCRHPAPDMCTSTCAHELPQGLSDSPRR